MATPALTTDVSVRWLTTSELVTSPSRVLPVTCTRSQPGSQVRPYYSTTPIHQVWRLLNYYSVEGDLAVPARVVKGRSVGRYFNRSLPLSDMMVKAVAGLGVLVRSKEQNDVY